MRQSGKTSRTVDFVVPFKLRGKKIIENMGEAFEAAENVSKYLS